MQITNKHSNHRTIHILIILFTLQLQFSSSLVFTIILSNFSKKTDSTIFFPKGTYNHSFLFIFSLYQTLQISFFPTYTETLTASLPPIAKVYLPYPPAQPYTCLQHHSAFHLYRSAESVPYIPFSHHAAHSLPQAKGETASPPPTDSPNQKYFLP